MNPGDVVYLKSGGPAMMVLSLDTTGDQSIECAVVTWFSGKEDKIRSFPLVCLSKTEPTV